MTNVIRSKRSPNLSHRPVKLAVESRPIFGDLHLAETLQKSGLSLGQSQIAPLANTQRKATHNPIFGGNLLTPEVIAALKTVAVKTTTLEAVSPDGISSIKNEKHEIKYSAVSTSDVVDSILNLKRNKRAKPSTLKTYEKRLRQFQRVFPRLPENSEPIMEYLAQFDGATGRHRRNHQDLLIMLYDHAAKRFGIKRNPMTELERPVGQYQTNSHPFPGSGPSAAEGAGRFGRASRFRFTGRSRLAAGRGTASQGR